VIEDLIRLGIIGIDQVAQQTPFDELSPTILRSEYSFSAYGVSFMQAVTAKLLG
jgi:hypothetical protein